MKDEIIIEGMGNISRELRNYAEELNKLSGTQHDIIKSLSNIRIEIKKINEFNINESDIISDLKEVQCKINNISESLNIKMDKENL